MGDENLDARLGAQLDKRLPGLDRSSVLDQEATDDSSLLRLDLIKRLHHLDDPDGIAAIDLVPLGDVRVRVRVRLPVERPRKRRDDRPVVCPGPTGARGIRGVRQRPQLFRRRVQPGTP